MFLPQVVAATSLTGVGKVFRGSAPLWITLAYQSTARTHAASSTMACTASAERVTADLRPQPLWQYFEEISSIPRVSKHEKEVLSYIKSFAEDRGLSWRQDSTGNMVVERQGMNGGEAADTVVIQGHVDMVTEKNSGTNHDFFKDPIRLVMDGDWVTADGTTLGADNGIGVAAALALLDLNASSGVKIPPLECLFTVDEETGLHGAYALDGSIIKGRTMLNLDTEEWGSLYVGCAGGGDSRIKLPVEKKPAEPTAHQKYRLIVEGLMGGHSGINIHEDRANAVVLLARILQGLLDEAPSVRLGDISGGDKHNAIPREAFATLFLPEGEYSEVEFVRQSVSRMSDQLQAEYGTKENTINIHMEELKGHEFQGRSYLTKASSERLVSLLSLLPHGVLKMSHDLEGLVETSNNVASVKEGTDDNTYEVLCSTRSSLGPSVEAVRRKIKTAALLCGASEVIQRPAYPGWQPDLESRALKVARDSLRDMLEGQEPIVTALHAGLECGVIGERAPGMDMVSFGPTIHGAHSPDERVDIHSVERFWDLVLATLGGLATK